MGLRPLSRIEVLGVLVNGTAVLGKFLIRLQSCTMIPVCLLSEFDEIIGHGGDPKSEGFVRNSRQFSSNFLRKIDRISGEKPVEIWLKTLGAAAY